MLKCVRRARVCPWKELLFGLHPLYASAQPSCTVGRRLVFVMWLLHTWHHDFCGTLVLSQLHRVLGISRPWESEKVQDVEDFCDPLLLECSSGWVLFWLAQFYIGVFLHYHGTIEVLLCLACYRKRHLMDWVCFEPKSSYHQKSPYFSSRLLLFRTSSECDVHCQCSTMSI